MSECAPLRFVARRRGCAAPAGWALALFLAGCAVGPDFVRPPAPASTRYTPQDATGFDAGDGETRQGVAAGRRPQDRWWQAFESSDLDRLVESVLEANPTLESARATLAQAGETVAAARGGWYPQVNLAAAASRSGPTVANPPAVIANERSIGPTVGFVPDVFGGTARRVEQASALREYQQAELDATCLSLAGDTVLQAIGVASAKEQLRAAQDIVSADLRNLELVRISMTAGRTANLDVLTAESQLAADWALLPPLRQQAAAAQHALALLAGRTNDAWTPPDFDLGALALPQDLPLTLPSELVRRRPDIVAAEAQLHAANAAIGIATAQLYPNLTLDASWSAQSIHSGSLFSDSANVWSIAASLLAPVYDAGVLRAQRAAARDAYAAQLGAYRQAVLQAFAQVADNLQALQNDADLLDAQRKALAAAEATLDLTRQSYEAGQASLLQILEAHRLYQQSRLGYVRAKAQRYLDTTRWFIGLGGSESACRLGRNRQ
jgi:NodT family efflux transporter outer membrane factor (OMF) lipoprotein